MPKEKEAVLKRREYFYLLQDVRKFKLLGTLKNNDNLAHKQFMEVWGFLQLAHHCLTWQKEQTEEGTFATEATSEHCAEGETFWRSQS